MRKTMCKNNIVLKLKQVKLSAGKMRNVTMKNPKEEKNEPKMVLNNPKDCKTIGHSSL